MKKISITIITSFPFPDGKATANRIEIFANEMAKERFIKKVNIISFSLKNSKTNNKNNKIRIIYEKLKKINKVSILKRIVQEIYLSFKIWNTAKTLKNNYIIITIPSIFLLLPKLFIKTKSDVIVDIRDFQWEYFSNYFLKNIIKLFIRAAIKDSKLVMVTNQSESKLLKSSFNIDPIIVANGISLKKFENYKKIKINLNKNYFDMTYIGNIGIAQELETLLFFAKKQKKINFHIVGDGVKLKTLKNIVDKEKLKNVFFYGAVYGRKIDKFIEKTDIFFAQIGSNYKSAVPSKIFDYLPTGRKVLLGLPKNSISSKIFSEFRGVKIFQSGNAKDLKKAFNQLVKSSFTEKDKNFNIRKLKNDYIREAEVKKLINFIKYKVGK